MFRRSKRSPCWGRWRRRPIGFGWGHSSRGPGSGTRRLFAKMISTLDVISGGRAEMGLGAGGTGEDAEAFGYDLPSNQRMARLGETLEIVRRLLVVGRDTWAGTTYRIDDAINNPRTVQASRIPIIVGGNGPTTMRLAARYADEINLDGPTPEGFTALLAKVAAACEAESRAPASLAVSLLAPPADLVATGSPRVRLLTAYREAGASRIMAALPEIATNERTLAAFAEDVRSAGGEMGTSRVTAAPAAI